MSFTGSINKLFSSSRAIILMYHRIAQPDVDPWQLSVSKENFESHLQELVKLSCVISAKDLVEKLKNKNLRNKNICITFDDGYQDNYLFALPLLEKHGCPSTFFISTGNIGSNEPYWWDMLTAIFLIEEKLPPLLSIRINNKEFNYILENDGMITREQKILHSKWHWPQEVPTQRCKIYLELWMHLRDLPSLTIRESIIKLKEWSCVEPANVSGNFPMTRQELILMSRSKFAHTGIHTITHTALASVSKQIQEAEITGCRDYLDENLNTHHDMIAFPYGNYNSDTLEVVKKAGLKAAFTTEAKAVTIRSDVHQLGRFQVVDQPGTAFRKQLAMWLKK